MNSWCFSFWCLTQITTRGGVGQKVIIHIMGDMYVVDRICIGYDFYQRLCTLASSLCMYSRMMSATGVYKVLDNLVLTIVALWFVLV